MNKYYYLLSQLPFLKFNEKTYVNNKVFIEEASKWLSQKDFAILTKISINDFYENPDDLQILKEYKNFEKNLREELVLKRSLDKSQDKNAPLRILNSEILEGNPLEVEKKLLLLRWDFIENLEGGHFFDLGFIVLYFLKIQILERLFTFDKEKGTVVFDSLCEVKV